MSSAWLNIAMVIHALTCLTSAQGWQWVNEGKSPDRPKWGFVSETEGDSLVVKVSALLLQTVQAHSTSSDGALILGIRYSSGRVHLISQRLIHCMSRVSDVDASLRSVWLF